jgi:pyruvate ferredoxin oxidoreductase gamma subunit
LFYEIIFYGRGGQGGVTAANILVYAALHEGLYAQGFPFFGAERRGAPVMAFARVSDKPILRHGMFHDTDILVVLDHRLIDMGVVKNINVRNNGIVVVNASSDYKIKPEEFKLEGKTRFYRVDATRIALENKLVVAGWPVVNTSMLGALSKATKIVSIDSVDKAIREYFGGRVGEINALAARQAYEKTEFVEEV